MAVEFKRLKKRTRQALRRFSLQWLPRNFANQIIRNQLDLDLVNTQSEFTYELASDTQTLKSGLQLVQRAFVKMGYAKDPGVRLTSYHLLPKTVVICVKRGSQVVACMTIVPDSPFGLPLETCISLNDVLVPNATVELSALAVDPSVSGQKGEILFNLLKFMYHCNVDLLDAKMEIIGVNPAMAPLYESIMLFDRVPGTSTTSYEFVNGAPVEPMFLDLRTARGQYEKVYGGLPRKKNMLEFFLAESPKHFVYPEKETIGTFSPQNDAGSLSEILSWRPEILKELDDSRFATLLNLYSGQVNCQEVLRTQRSQSFGN